jgi:hypothetical protein
MADTFPGIVPTGFTGTYRDFLLTKTDRSGAVRRVQGSVSIPASTATDTIIGLFPFTAGMSLSGLSGFNLYSADLDSSTNVTLDWGVQYQNTTEGTTDLDLITSASTAPQAGGFVAPDEIDWMTHVTTGNGWVVAQVNAATTTTGSLTFNIPFVYDQPVLIA